MTVAEMKVHVNTRHSPFHGAHFEVNDKSVDGRVRVRLVRVHPWPSASIDVPIGERRALALNQFDELLDRLAKGIH